MTDQHNPPFPAASDPDSADPPVDPDLQLERDVFFETVNALRTQMPPPLDDTPAGRMRYYRVSVAQVVALEPGSGPEAMLAASHVACLAHAAYCRGQLNQCLDDLAQAGKLRAQSASMGREARGFLNSLTKLQAMRIRRDGDEKSRDRAALARYCIQGLMARALEAMPAEVPLPPKPVAPEPAAKRAAAPPQRAVFESEPEPTEEDLRRARLVHDVDMYTVVYPLRARVIRRLGGMPPDAPFEAPEPEVMAELLVANRSNQEWVDGMTPEQVLIDGGHDRMGWPYEPDADPDVVRAALLRAGVDWRPGLPWGALSAASVGM